MVVLPLVVPKRVRKVKTTEGVSDTSLVRGGPSLLLLGGLLCSLGDLATLLGLLDGFDDTDSNGLPHITDGETTERGILVVGLYTHGLTWNELGNAGITGLDELRRILEGLAASPVDFFNQLGELTGDVGSVTIQKQGRSPDRSDRDG